MKKSSFITAIMAAMIMIASSKMSAQDILFLNHSAKIGTFYVISKGFCLIRRVVFPKSY